MPSLVRVRARPVGDAGAVAVGEADEQAAELLQAAMTETIGTSGGAPLDPYTAALVRASIADLQAEVVEQGRQVDIATAAGGRGRLADPGSLAYGTCRRAGRSGPCPA